MVSLPSKNVRTARAAVQGGNRQKSVKDVKFPANIIHTRAAAGCTARQYERGLCSPDVLSDVPPRPRRISLRRGHPFLLCTHGTRNNAHSIALSGQAVGVHKQVSPARKQLPDSLSARGTLAGFAPPFSSDGTGLIVAAPTPKRRTGWPRQERPATYSGGV